MNATARSRSGRKLPTANCISSLTTSRWERNKLPIRGCMTEESGKWHTYDTNRFTESVEITKILIEVAFQKSQILRKIRTTPIVMNQEVPFYV